MPKRRDSVAMIFDLARFPISGPKTAPTAEDYAFEAGLMLAEAEKVAK